MEDEEIVDSGIESYSEAEELEELREKVKELEQENEDLREELDDKDRDISDLEYRIQSVIEDNDRDEIKSDVLVDIARRMTMDGIITPQLEEWLENYGRFYVDEV